METHDVLAAAATAPRTNGPHDAGRPARRIAAVTGVVTVSLAVAAALHLAGLVSGRRASFDPAQAGAAEALIGVVLAAATVALWREGAHARAAGLAALGFAIAGFLFGLTFTLPGGHWPDIAYHLSVLPLLVASFVALLRAGGRPRSRDRRR